MTVAVAIASGGEPRGGPEGGEARALAAAFLAAFLLHAGALGAVALWRSAPVAAPPGEQEIAIDLAPQMIEAPAVAAVGTSRPAGEPAEAVPLEPPVETLLPAPPEALQTTEAVEPPPSQAAPPPVAAQALPPPDSQPIAATTVDAVPVPETVTAALPPEAVPARPLLEPKAPPKPAPKQAERKVAPERKPPPPAGAAGRTQREAQAGQSSRENTGGSAASAVDPAAMSRWTSQIAASLRGRLRYPDAARASGASGVATLRFTLHRSGRVVSASLARSAGHPALDQAALATASGALPAAPEGVPQQQVTISVPLRFDMR